jgi:hypothetical protein
VFIPAAIAAVAGILLTAVVDRRLQSFDDLATRGRISFGFDAVLLENVCFPGRGITADSLWVIFHWSFFCPHPVQVVLKGGVFSPTGQVNSGSSEVDPLDIPPVSFQDAYLPDGTRFFANRTPGGDIMSLEGNWGSMAVCRNQGHFTSAFRRVSGFPMHFMEIPPLLAGHTVSGVCSGTTEPFPDITGRITELDGESAEAVFTYKSPGGIPVASLQMDFSQVSGPAMVMLDELTGGAVMTAAPSGSLLVSLQSADSVFFSTELHFDSVFIYSPLIAPDTFSTGAALECSGYILPVSNFVKIDSGRITLGSAGMEFDMTCEWGDRRMLALHLWNPSLSGESITSSVPSVLLGRLQGLTLRGEMSFFMNLVLDWNEPDSCKLDLDIDASGLYVGYCPVSLSSLSSSSGGATCTMRDSWGNTRTIALDAMHSDTFVSFDSIPSFFEPLLCCAEDASFRSHHGFSEYHLRNSIIADMEQGRFVRGGSTISMQLAKNLFLGREKTLARKLQEVFLTWRLETLLSKDRILELYANIVELGPGVFGFNAAGLYYFNKPMTELSVREMAFLVSILPGPRVYHQYAVRGELPHYWTVYVDRLITICGNRGWIDSRTVTDALGDSLIFSGPVSLQ